MRHGQIACMKDIDVRKLINVPSIDCRLRKMRLRYLSRMLKNGPDALITLLSAKCPSSSSRLPWTTQVVSDLRVLHNFFPSQLQELPDPESNADPWFSLISTYPKQWLDIVGKYHTCASCLDEVVTAAEATACSSTTPLTCSLCVASSNGDVKVFKSAKALAQHQRILHKVKSPIPLYIDDSGICPACNVNLYCRAKVVTHACEVRYRSKTDKLRCCDVILSGVVPKIDASLFVRLEDRDRILKRNAKSSGRSHVISIKPACRVSSAAANRRRQLPPNFPNVYRAVKRGLDSTDSLPPPKHQRTGFVPIKRISVKSSPDSLQQVPAKRLRCKSSSHLLYRRV